MRPEQDAFLERLFRAHFHELQIHAFRFLGNWDDAQTAVQDSFHTACEKIDVLMSSPNPVGWMKLTVKNVARNMVRARSRQAKWLTSWDELPDYAMPAQPSPEEDAGPEAWTGLVSQSDLDLLRQVALDGVS